jgi:hypothetical protein
MRGVRGRALSPWAHNAGAAYKTRGQPGRMFGGNPSCRAASPGGGEWHGQALQGDTIPDPAGRVGKVLEIQPAVEFSRFWVGWWEYPGFTSFFLYLL